MAGSRTALAGGVVGPAAFVGAWAVGGLIADSESPVDDAISRLAAVGATSRPVMTAGFLVFGAGMAAFAVGLRSALRGRAWVAALAAGGCTIGVAAVPLDNGHDGLHGALAGAGYVALLAVPLLAARPLGRGRTVPVVVAFAAGACLVAMDEGQIHDGEVVGEVESGSTRLPVRTPFTGHLMGMLAQVGWRVRAGEPVAWLRTDLL